MSTFETERGNVGAGWQPIIEALHRDLLKLDPDYTVDQIKEKFGGLRYYVGASEGVSEKTYDEMERLIQKAEELAGVTCEDCGSPGELHGGGWLRTLCDQCQAKRTAVKS